MSKLLCRATRLYMLAYLCIGMRRQMKSFYFFLLAPTAIYCSFLTFCEETSVVFCMKNALSMAFKTSSMRLE